MIPTGWIARDGVQLAVHDAGGPGTPVLFQHGLCGDARQTAEAFPALPGWRRVTLECRGHGASEPGKPRLSLALLADDLAAQAERLGPPVVAGGISMGAALALRLAVTRPGLIRALVLVRPAWGVGPAGPNLAPNAEVGDLLTHLPPDAARARFAAGATAARLAQAAPDNLVSLMGFFDRRPRDETARLLRELATDDSGLTAANLGALRLPVLVCATGEDAIHPAALAEDLAARIPGARLARLPPKGRDKTAHLAALHAEITAFLKEL